MATTPRPGSVRALGARRLMQTTVAVVVAGVGGVIGLAIHDAQATQAAPSNSPSASGTSTTDSSDSSSTSTSSGTWSPPSGSTGSQPQATSGGS